MLFDRLIKKPEQFCKGIEECFMVEYKSKDGKGGTMKIGSNKIM